jgi:hypothetical protein
MRFTGRRAELTAEAARKCASICLKEGAIVVNSGGASYFCEDGPVITRDPVVQLRLPDSIAEHQLGCLAWLKSSFFIWYCSVHLSDQNFYRQLQDPSIKIPFPKPSKRDFYRRLDSLAHNIVVEEKRFLDEARREKKKGVDWPTRDKLRKRHNASANSLCLSIDKEISDFLSLTSAESEFVAQTLVDIGVSDFGYLQHLQDQRDAKDEDEE